MKDYLTEYITETGFNIPKLLHDDFFEAIKLCWNNKKYISCAKLLVCFIDTLGFLRFGDDSQAFVKWLDEYVDLSKLGIKSSEFWEHRNALLHMTTLKSRKVAQGKTPMLVAYIGFISKMPQPPDGEKWYCLGELMTEVPKGIENFIIDFVHGNNIPLFVERYDQIVSDQRYLKIEQ